MNKSEQEQALVKQIVRSTMMHMGKYIAEIEQHAIDIKNYIEVGNYQRAKASALNIQKLIDKITKGPK